MRSFKELLDGSGPVMGTWSQIANPDVVEILGASGFDFTIIDMEHTAFSFETVESLIRACEVAGMAPLVRVRGNDRSQIGKALDMGAAAVVVPGIGSPEDATAAVDATRFEPDGTRGACPFIRAGRHAIRTWRTFSQLNAALTGAVLLVETRQGLENLEAIVAVPGIRCLLAGPYDLSVSLGHQGDYLHPDVQEAVEHIVDVATRADIPLMMPVFMPDASAARKHVAHWMTRGVRLFTVGGDKILLLDYCTRYLTELTSPPLPGRRPAE